MANWCFNRIMVVGPKTKVNEIHKKFKNTIKELTTDTHICISVYEFLKKLNWSDTETLSLDVFYSRDHILSIADVCYNKRIKKYCFMIQTESAWSPHVNGFYNAIHNKYNGTVELYYISEEPGNELYETNDLDYKIFKSQFILDYYNGNISLGEKYFETKQKLLKFIKEQFNVKADKDDNLDIIKGRILEKTNIVKQNSTHYVNIYSFKRRTIL